MTQINLEFPQEVQSLLEKTIFELDAIDPDALNKYLFYMPEVIRIVGLVVAQLKNEHRELSRRLQIREAEILLETVNAIDGQKYKNEQLRTAKVMTDESYQGIRKEISETEYQIDKFSEEAWKWKNLNSNLDNISRLRVSERKF